MPLQAIKINDFNSPLMRETTITDELTVRIQDLYQADTRYHNFATAEQAIEYFKQAFANEDGYRRDDYRGDGLYVGMFNDKPICAVLCRRICTGTDVCVSDGTANKNTESLDFLAMHQQNLNRGIEEQFLKLICQDKQHSDVQFTSNNEDILKMIQNLP